MVDRPVVAVGGVIIEDRRILLIQRGADPHMGMWAVPGGKVAIGETLAHAVAREISEETGILVEVGEIAWVGESLGEGFHHVLIDFYARVVGGELVAGSDAAAAAWYSADELSRLSVPPSMADLLGQLVDRGRL